MFRDICRSSDPIGAHPVHISYARVSTDDQDLALQRAALGAAGCRRTYEEKISGARRDRPALERMLGELREGDVVVVTRLDRLARSTTHLLEIPERLRAADAGLRSLAEPWADTTTPSGKMVLTMFAGVRSSNGR
jgi:DNA invertase Pin-like site-specific DNA recombinase